MRKLKQYFKGLTGLTLKTFTDYYAVMNNVSKKEARARIDEFTKTLVTAVHDFGKVDIDNFGTFETAIFRTGGCALSCKNKKYYTFMFENELSHFEVVADLSPYFKYCKKPPKVFNLDYDGDDE